MAERLNSTQVRLREAAIRLFAERGVAQVSVSDLADAAQVARGTIYNNYPSIEALFETVATQLTTAMQARIEASTTGVVDPAARLATGLRSFIRHAHGDPAWGRFVQRFGATTPTLRRLLDGALARDLNAGIAAGRFAVRADQLPSVVAVLSGGVLAAMSLVLEGHRTWRDAGTDTAELSLRALGLSADEALDLASRPLPALEVDPPPHRPRRRARSAPSPSGRGR